MSYGKALLYRSWATSEFIQIDSKLKGSDLWIRRVVLDERIGERAAGGSHRIRASFQGYSWTLSGMAYNNSWLLLEQMVAESGNRFEAGQDGYLILEDHLNRVPEAKTSLNGRTIISGSTASTGRGFTSSLCAFKVVVKLPEDFDQILAPESRHIITCNVEEAP